MEQRGQQPDTAPGLKAPLKASMQKYQLKRILDTREGDLLDDQPPLSLQGLEQYAEGSASQLLYLQLAAAGVSSREADHAASHLGKAVGMTTLLKGTAFHAKLRRCYLPLDLCAQHGVSQEDIYNGIVSEGMRDIVLKIASTAKAHLDEARSLQSKVPPLGRHLLLPSVSCENFLKSLEAVNFDPYDTKLLKGGVSPFWYVMQIKWHLWSRTF
ncbi:hypothetical protein CEUSTIGMA_g2879.t1 [Chlamydomonas eustigma]|uniref:Phytoene synthase n=1 Tax=Chlamydomonas eustigma TaxID=1157962 RepID=A0A250WXC1_9CHLO|nr:hypothetical protein CEUSTIGMA_g2879.t1 [Chlamydomonas eustigma]|eukprot:GAX75435.1 hypothetical protein CEUSTIGMA_g2879.t1 [Chlamydomonas eustigma]